MKYKIDVAIVMLFICIALLGYKDYTVFYANLILAFIAVYTREIKMHIDEVLE